VESLGELAASDGLKDKPIQKNLENQKIVFLTSGSSGKPKLISHSRQTLEAAAAASNRATGLGTSHSWLIALPFYHLGGFSIFVRCKLAGAQAFLAEGNESSLSSSSLLKSLQRSCPDFLSLVPKQLEGLVKEEETWSRPKVILIGGAPLSPELRKRAREKALPVIETWGMTEAASSLAFLSEKRELIRLDNVSLRASASSKDLGENELSMEVQSTGVFLSTEQGEGSWFATGDRFRKTPTGRYRILGREDRMIISGGENIYPAEIEIEARNFKGVSEAAVVGIESRKWGERPVMFVVLESFKLPDFIVELEELPKLSIGKIDYSELSRQAKSLH